MKPFSLPCLFIGLIITLCCNYSYAQNPILLISGNPTTCNGSEGSITFSNLTPNGSYQISYTDDGAPIGPITIVANATGQITIPSLNAGVYTDLYSTLAAPLNS